MQMNDATARHRTVDPRGGRVIALDCVNLARDYVPGRRLVAEPRAVDRLALADPRMALKML